MKEKKSIKSWFIVDDEEQEVQKTVIPPTTKDEVKFPTRNSNQSDMGKVEFPTKVENVTTPIPTKSGKNPFLDDIISFYQKGFDGLNYDGYDFYEFYQAINKFDSITPETVKMGLSMAEAMHPTVSSSSLTSQANQYVSEIEKVYNEYVSKGNTRQSEVEAEKAQEKQGLNNEIRGIEAEIARLTGELTNKRTTLSQIDNKYQLIIGEITQKLEANQIAKDHIVGKINTVVSTINQIK